MPESPQTTFDQAAADYDAQLHRGVSLSGERKEFFAEARVRWLQRRLGGHLDQPGTIMDYGCGTGSALPFLRAGFAPRALVGIDISSASLELARRTDPGADVRFARPQDYAPRSNIQLIFSNGTIHHVPPPERPGTLRYLAQALAPGGWLAIWENNPWNPGTRMVMHRIPFDRDAVPISGPALARLVCAAGLTVHHVDYLFIFPAALRALRTLEPHLVRWPLGAQYLVLAQKAPVATSVPNPATASRSL